MNSSKAILYTVIFLSLFSLGCGSMIKAKPLAEKGVKDFHQQFNEQKFGEIYQHASSKFKEATTLEKWNELSTAIFRKLGSIKSSKNQNWNVRNFNLTTLAVLIQNTTFESGTGVETFTFEIVDDQAFLAGYNINSNDLITK